MPGFAQMSSTIAAHIEDGQFEDSPDDTTLVPSLPTADPRNGYSYIDEDPINLAESSGSDDFDLEDEEKDAFEEEEDALEASAYDTLRAEDEDWEIAERDFTKQYNRLKQHVAVRTGAARGITSSLNAHTSVAPLPAVNRPRPQNITTSSTVANVSTTAARDKTADQLQVLAKYSSRLRNIDMPYDLGVGVNRKGPSATANLKDKSDRATSEQVLDPRTRIILFKMIGRGLIFEVNGCVSTGKEANVYHALTMEKEHLALKIYKTSILIFKDRDRYVSGEYRFRRGYSRHNPRKMVRVWAEKEMRNLKRLRTAGIRCPEPIEVRENVLVMGFVGDKDGWASPRLKDATIPNAEFPALYSELLSMTRKMFHECKLVHADLSEYNILYHIEAPPQDTPSSSFSPTTSQGSAAPEHQPHGQLWIIDVSQSVEHDHPHAFDFLRADLRNVEDFFSRRGARTLGLRRAFEFVTRVDLVEGGSKSDPGAVLQQWIDEADTNADADGEDSREDDDASRNKHYQGGVLEDAVFMQSYIPRTLNEVVDPERDVGKLNRGEGKSLIYRDTIGVVNPALDKEDDADGGQKENKGKVRFETEDKLNEREESQSSSEDEGEGEDENSDESGVEDRERKPRGHRHEDRDCKKERKKAVKEEAREKRKHKIPKAEKKRKIKTTAR